MISKIIFLIIVILLIFSVVLSYLKNVILYHPYTANPEKYDRFFLRLLQLVESEQYLSNYVITTIDGALLDTIYLHNPDADKCIIYSHGNAGNLSMRYDMIKFLYNYASVVLFDYRSFGRSGGNSLSLTAQTMQNDAQAVWIFTINTLKYNPNQISFFGESLGCAVAISLCAYLSRTMGSEYYPYSLICNAPFSSLSSMIQTFFMKLGLEPLGKIMALLIKSEYQSDMEMRYLNQQTKIIIAHSPRDEVIPFSEGRRLYDMVSQTHERVEFITITGTHNNLGLTDQYIYALAKLFHD